MELCLNQERDGVERPWQAVCLAIAAIALGIAIHIRDGLVEPRAIAWLTVAVGFALAAFARLPTTSKLHRIADRGVKKLLTAGIAVDFVLLLTYRLPEAWHAGHVAWPYYVLLAIAGLVAATLYVVPRAERLAFPLLLVLFAVTGTWVLHVSAQPRMDVWVAQTAGLEQLRHGATPWTSTFPDVYGMPDLYAPGTLRNGVVHLGFPYPPLTVWLDLPGHWIAGDFRWSNLAYVVIAAGLMGYARPGKTAKLAAVMFLFTPRVFLVLRNGWTEPQVAMLLAAVVFCACRFRRALPFVLGLLLVSKQYMFVAVAPTALLLNDRGEAKRFYPSATATAAVVSLPLALWNLPAYWHANFAAAASAKFRFDALSFFAYWADTRDWTPPAWIGFVSLAAVAPATVFVLRRGTRSPAGFAAATAAAFLVFFSLNKFAFCNYYYFVVATLCASVAASQKAATVIQAGNRPEIAVARLAA